MSNIDPRKHHAVVLALEWYADPTHYHPNGTPGSIVKEFGIEMWEPDRGNRARKVMEELKSAPPEDPEEIVYACSLCGSERIQGTAYVDLNKNELSGDEHPSDELWCPDCGVNSMDGPVRLAIFKRGDSKRRNIEAGLDGPQTVPMREISCPDEDVTFKAKSWIATHREEVMNAVAKVGLEAAAADYSCYLAEEQDIDYATMEEAIRATVMDRLKELEREIANADDLDKLRELLDEASELAVAAGYGCVGHVIDLTSLPTFDGVEPADTMGVASWDKDRILWLEDWTIEDR